MQQSTVIGFHYFHHTLQLYQVSQKLNADSQLLKQKHDEHLNTLQLWMTVTAATQNALANKEDPVTTQKVCCFSLFNKFSTFTYTAT